METSFEDYTCGRIITMKLKLYGCFMTYNRMDELKKLQTVHRIIPYIDQLIMIDGSCGTDGTSEWILKEFPDKSIMIVNSRWSDDFPGQRTQYLNLVGELREPTEESWCCVFDTDEVYSELLAKNIRAIIERAIQDGRTMVQIRSRSITINSNGDRIWENMDDFYKPLIFKYYKGMQYWGDRSEITDNKTALHEALQLDGKFVWKPIRLDDKGKLYYEHIKNEDIIWERGFRNLIVMGGGPNLGNKQPLWKPLRDLLADIMQTQDYTSYDVLEYCRKGNIDHRLKDWMIEHRNENGYDGASEVREAFLCYFILYHPEEMPNNLIEEYKYQIEKER